MNKDVLPDVLDFAIQHYGATRPVLASFIEAFKKAAPSIDIEDIHILFPDGGIEIFTKDKVITYEDALFGCDCAPETLAAGITNVPEGYVEAMVWEYRYEQDSIAEHNMRVKYRLARCSDRR